MISFHIRGSHGEVWVHGGWSSGELWKFGTWMNNHWMNCRDFVKPYTALSRCSIADSRHSLQSFWMPLWPGENGQNGIQNDCNEWLLSCDFTPVKMLAGLTKSPSSSKFIQVPDCPELILGSAIADSVDPLHICVDMSISTCRDDLSFPFCILFVLFAFCTVFRCIFPIFVRICAFFPREV